MPANSGRRYHWTAEQLADMRDLYEAEKWSARDIAAHFGCSPRTVQYHLALLGVEPRPRGMQTERAKAKYRGPLHHSWKGGRLRDHGYIRILKSDHPQANKYGYVLEHRIVVEADLRLNNPDHPALLPGGGIERHRWHVHHINGVKDDNRLENLQILPREQHSSWMHYKDEMARLRALLVENGIAA